MAYKINLNNSDIKFKLDKIMTEKNISKNKLGREAGLRFETVQGYYKGTISKVDLYVLSQLCKTLNCKVEDIIEYCPTKSEKDVN